MRNKTKEIMPMVLIIILIVGFLTSGVLAQSSAYEGPSEKIFFYNLEALSEHRFVIAQESGAVLAQIYNAKDRKIEMDLIRSGRGPFELEFLGGMAFNKQTKKLYAVDIQSGRILCFDEQGKGIKEKNLKITYAKNLDAFREELILTPGTLVSKRTPNKNKYSLAYLLDSNTLEVSGTLFFDLDELNLDQIQDIEKVDSFDLRPLVVSSFKNGLYLVVFESFNKIFLINKNSEIEDRIELNVNNIKTPKIVRSPSFGYGQRAYPVLNDYVRKGESIYFSFGQVSENTRHGLIRVEISNTNKLSAQNYSLKTELEAIGPFNPYKVTSDGGTIYSADGIDIIPLSINWEE